LSEIIPLEIKFDYAGAINTIFPALIKDEKELILVDCGYPGFLPLIRAASLEKGVNLDDLTKAIITHHDFDHIGSLAALKRIYPGISVLSSQEEERYINGMEKSLRLQQAEAIYDKLPDDQKAGAMSFHKMLEAIEKVSVDGLLKDGDCLPWCGGMEIVATPGHMPGHISIYLKEHKTLISGDALVVENNHLAIANPQYTLDLAEAKRSIGKLLNYDIERVICYHGGVFANNVKVSLEELIEI